MNTLSSKLFKLGSLAAVGLAALVVPVSAAKAEWQMHACNDGGWLQDWCISRDGRDCLGPFEGAHNTWCLINVGLNKPVGETPVKPLSAEDRAEGVRLQHELTRMRPAELDRVGTLLRGRPLRARNIKGSVTAGGGSQPSIQGHNDPSHTPGSHDSKVSLGRNLESRTRPVRPLDSGPRPDVTPGISGQCPDGWFHDDSSLCGYIGDGGAAEAREVRDDDRPQ